MNQERKSWSALGVTALIMSILGFFGGIFIIPPFVFGIPALIIAIIGIVYKRDKILAIISIVISTMSLITALLIIFIGITFTNEPEINEDTYILIEINDNLTGFSWQLGDKSTIELDRDGSFVWWRLENVRNDQYYQGTYEVFIDDEAVTALISTGYVSPQGLDSLIETYNQVCCLVLTNEKCVVDQVDTIANEEPIKTYYYILFTDEEKNSAYGINVRTQHEIELTKIIN